MPELGKINIDLQSGAGHDEAKGKLLGILNMVRQQPGKASAESQSESDWAKS